MGKAHEIKDPVAQAKSEKYAILKQLQSYQSWVALQRRITIGHSVLFPDLESIAAIRLPECPQGILGGKAELRDVEGWLKGVYKFWKDNDQVPLGTDGLRIVEDVLCRPIEVRPLLRDILEEDNKLRIRLTNEQSSVLRTLARRKRAAIVGAAGTGKTILAAEKVRTLASIGAKVLFLCYNKALGATLSRQFAPSDRVLVCTFHQFSLYCLKLCAERGIPDPLNRAKSEAPNDNLYDVQLPLATFYAIEELGDDLRYDAIVIDEGQDFGEEYWLPIEMALRSSEDSWLYIFYDENQRLYYRVSSFPVPEDDTFLLTKNCRNTKPVHDLAYRYYEGESIDDSGIDGTDPIIAKLDSPESQAKEITKLITKLINDDKVTPESIAVLIAGQRKEYFYDLLRNKKLPKNVMWTREEHFQTSSVLLDTVKRFKGLERDVIFLWVSQDTVSNDALLYVGISRAKSVLYLIGDRASLEAMSL